VGNNNSHCNVANKRVKMKILTIIWGILIIYCILEAYFCTKFEEENNIEQNLNNLNKKNNGKE